MLVPHRTKVPKREKQKLKPSKLVVLLNRIQELKLKKKKERPTR